MCHQKKGPFKTEDVNEKEGAQQGLKKCTQLEFLLEAGMGDPIAATVGRVHHISAADFLCWCSRAPVRPRNPSTMELEWKAAV